jgi:hypothetical protein
VASDWNLAVESLLGAELTLEELKLGLAIVRETLGYNRRERAVGQRLLRDWTGFHGRSFDRAREGLLEKWDVQLTRGQGGRGNRDSYLLLLDRVLARREAVAAHDAMSAESPAPPRANDLVTETTASQRAIGTDSPAETPAATPAAERGRKEEGGGTNLKSCSDEGITAAVNSNVLLDVDAEIIAVLGRDVVEDVLRQNFTPEAREAIFRAKVMDARQEGSTAP